MNEKARQELRERARLLEVRNREIIAEGAERDRLLAACGTENASLTAEVARLTEEVAGQKQYASSLLVDREIARCDQRDAKHLLAQADALADARLKVEKAALQGEIDELRKADSDAASLRRRLRDRGKERDDAVRGEAVAKARYNVVAAQARSFLAEANRWRATAGRALFVGSIPDNYNVTAMIDELTHHPEPARPVTQKEPEVAGG